MPSTEFFTIPDSSCYMTSCYLVSTIGATVYDVGTMLSEVYVLYSGTGSTATVTFTI